MTIKHKVFAALSTLTAADVNTYLMNQTTVNVDLESELSSLPATVKMAYVTGTGRAYSRRATGSAWVRMGQVPVFASLSDRNAYYPNPVAGDQCFCLGTTMTHDGTAWRFILTGTVSQGTDANGVITFNHNAGQGATSVQITPVNSGDAVDLRVKWLVQSLVDPATISVRAIRTDTTAPFGSNLMTFYWMAKF